MGTVLPDQAGSKKIIASHSHRSTFAHQMTVRDDSTFFSPCIQRSIVAPTRQQFVGPHRSASPSKQATCHYSTSSYSSLRRVAYGRMPAPAAKKVNVAPKSCAPATFSVAASELVGGFRNTRSPDSGRRSLTNGHKVVHLGYQKKPIMQTATSSRRQLRLSSWTCQLAMPNGRVLFQQIEKACISCRRITLNASILRRIARAYKSNELLRSRDNVR